MKNKELLEWYYQQGLNIIPVPKGKKGAVIRWKQYEETKAPKIQSGYEGNIAVILGKTSGNLIDIDCDTKELFDLAQKILPETLTTKSYRGGHLYYYTDYPIRKFTLDISKYGKLEVACQGQISILPPSLHPKGIQYKFIKKVSPAHWHGDVKEELIELIETNLKIKLKRERINIKRILEGVGEGERDDSAIKLATWWRKEGLTQSETLEKMLEWNQNNNPPLEDGVIEIKVESAFKPEKPYGYKFAGKPKIKPKFSCGMVLPDKIFEQANGEFLIYDKATGETTKRKTVEGWKPFPKLPWKPVGDVSPYKFSELWSEIKQYLYEHIDISEGYDLLTAWVLASWIHENWHAVPYLFFYGPAGSGKTWALEILASIVFRPLMSASATLSTIFRVINDYHPTMFLDECETYMRKERSEILHLLNAGYRKGFPAMRSEDTKDGYVVKFYDCFGFKGLAGTKEFIKTLKSRCIIFNMSKAVRKIKTTIDTKKAKGLQRMLLSYRFEMLSKKEKMEPPNVLTGRLRELFDPLIMVAPETAKNSIIQQAKKIEQSTEEEERTSDEAFVFKAVYEINQAQPKRKITIEEIAKVTNENISIYEQISNVSIGRILSKLGFKKTMHEHKRAIFWNAELAERLQRRYLKGESKDLTQF